MTFLHVTDASEVYERQICCFESGQFRKEHIEMAVDLKSTNILQFVMKLLRAINFEASVILYGQCSRIDKLCL